MNGLIIQEGSMYANLFIFAFGVAVVINTQPSILVEILRLHHNHLRYT